MSDAPEPSWLHVLAHLALLACTYIIPVAVVWGYLYHRPF